MAKHRYTDTGTVRIGVMRSDLALPDIARPESRRGRVDLDKSEVPDAYTSFQDLFEAVYDAVIVTNREGEILKVNRRTLDYFGYDQDVLIELNILNLIDGSDANLITSTLDFLEKETRVFIEAYCMRQDGTLFPSDITVNSLRLTESGQLAFFVRDVTYRKQTEEQLEHAQAELVQSAHSAGMADLATSVLHDVGNILNSINVSCDVIAGHTNSKSVEALNQANALLESHKDDLASFFGHDPQGRMLPLLYQKLGTRIQEQQKELKEEADNLQKKIDMIKNVISTQQQYAKIGHIVEHLVLADVIDDALSVLTASMQRHNVVVEKQYAELPKLNLLKSKLIHILLNLIKNAKDAMADNPTSDRRLQIETRQENGEVLLILRDNGAGIEADHLTRIFNHGFTTKTEGHGFGLHTCANLMTEMGGHIGVDSPGVGEGATFTLVFPLTGPADSE